MNRKDWPIYKVVKEEKKGIKIYYLSASKLDPGFNFLIDDYGKTVKI